MNQSSSLPLNNFLAANHIVCNVIGIPLNLLTAAFITLSPRLHQTRNILWLGVAFSNVLVLSTHLVEFYAYQFQSETAKKIFSLAAGLPYASLMLNLFLSLVDRYISIAHSAWYKRKVTITWIVSGKIGCFSIVCLLIKGPYLLDFIPLPSEVTFMEIKIFSVIGTIPLMMCIVGQIFVYFKVKCYLTLEKEKDIPIMVLFNRRTENLQVRNTQFTDGELQKENSLDDFHDGWTATASITPQNAITSPYFIQIGNQAISRLELEASRNALNSVTFFLLLALPNFATAMFAINADCLPATFSIGEHCSKYLWAFAYTRGLMLIYPVINPIMFTTCSHDLLQALNRSG